MVTGGNYGMLSGSGSGADRTGKERRRCAHSLPHILRQTVNTTVIDSLESHLLSEPTNGGAAYVEDAGKARFGETRWR